MIDQARVELAKSGRFGDLGRAAHWGTSDRQARDDALLGLLARETTSVDAALLAGALGPLDPTAEDKRQARGALLGRLTRKTNSLRAAELAGALGPLDPTAEDKRQARGALLGRLTRETTSRLAAELADKLAQLDPTVHDLGTPTVHDLGTWRAWAVRPTAELLAAVRRNSALTNWLAVLPSLTSLSGPPS
jgi:hypothetical protein